MRTELLRIVDAAGARNGERDAAREPAAAAPAAKKKAAAKPRERKATGKGRR
jgi:hypothetical protein